MIVLIVCAITLLLAGVLSGAVVLHQSRRPLKYDVNHVRELEMEIWGYYFTLPPEKKALPTPPKGSGGVSPAKEGPRPKKKHHNISYHCSQCFEKLYSASGTCQKCTQQVLEERRYKREQEAKAKRVRHVEFFGQYYEARIPDGVPDNAHLEIENQGLDSSFATWAHWKWTDESTGYPMGLKSSAFAVEKYDVTSPRGVIKNYYAPRIGTQMGYK